MSSPDEDSPHYGRTISLLLKRHIHFQIRHSRGSLIRDGIRKASGKRPGQTLEKTPVHQRTYSTPHTNPSKHGRNTKSQHRTNKPTLQPFLNGAYLLTIAPLSHPGSYQILLFTSRERKAEIQTSKANSDLELSYLLPEGLLTPPLGVGFTQI